MCFSAIYFYYRMCQNLQLLTCPFLLFNSTVKICNHLWIIVGKANTVEEERTPGDKFKRWVHKFYMLPHLKIEFSAAKLIHTHELIWFDPWYIYSFVMLIYNIHCVCRFPQMTKRVLISHVTAHLYASLHPHFPCCHLLCNLNIGLNVGFMGDIYKMVGDDGVMFKMMELCWT